MENPVVDGYISLDLETTGLSSEDNQILEIGAVFDDFRRPIDELPKFNVILVSKDDYYVFNSIAADMNRDLISEIAKIQKKGYKETDTLPDGFAWREEANDLFMSFLTGCGLDVDRELTFAGKNFRAFDLPFLLEADVDEVKIHRRTIDLGNLYWDPSLDGFTLPDSKTCFQRAGLNTEVKHRALGDALDVVRCIRAKFGIIG